MSNKILVLGGTGKTGRRVAARLAQLSIPFRIGSRNAEPAFHWDSPATWSGVLNGIDKIYICFQPDLAIPSAPATIKAFVELAKQSGVKQLVLLSGRGEKEAQACEDIVVRSGLNWTIVRASWFMQNFSEGFLLDAILENKVVLPIIKAKEPFVDADDIADTVVQALTNQIHFDKIYELTGPELLSFEDAVSKITAVNKRDISYQEIPIEEYVSVLRNYQLPEDFISLLHYLFTEVLDGRNEFITDDIEMVLGRKAGSFDNYIMKTNETGTWKIS